MSVLTFIIVCPLVFLAGFVDAIAGGGGLISLPAYMIAGLPVHTAIATNKLSSGMGTSISVGRLAKRGSIPWKQAVFCICAALIGSFTGAQIALRIEADIFKRIMLVIVPVTAFYVMRTKTLGDGTGQPNLAKAVLFALVIGAYDGFYGPGTGTFLLLLLTSFAGYRLNEANGIAKTINLTTNITSLTVYLINGKVLILLGLCAGLCSIAGNYIGISFFEKKGSRIVRPIMITVLIVFFIRILTEL